MSWLDRLRTSIKLTSPDGNEFEALWRGNSRSAEKQLGIFKVPKVKGVRIDDLDVGADFWPLTVWFDGPDNDLESERFVTALKERGLWNIIHPVKGEKNLQLVSFSEAIEPVSSGNLTVFTTDWLEPLDVESLPSITELRAAIQNQINDNNGIAADQLDNNSQLEKAGEVASFRTGVNNTVMSVDLHLKGLYEQNAEVNAQIISIKRGINDTLAVLPLDVLSLAGQIQTLIQLPALSVRDVTARINAYTNLINGIFTQGPDNNLPEDINTVAIQEASLTAALGSVAFITSTGELTVRSEATGLIEGNLQLFSDVTDDLDTSAELFENNPIDLQYFSQSESFNSTVLMMAQTVAYLLRAVFDLSIEKRFILAEEDSPIMITLREYGTLGEADVMLQFFIDTNNLIADEILFLPAGFEVVIYV